MEDRQLLFVDLETYSSISLNDCGVYRYAESPDFTILLLGYAFNDDPVTVIDLANGETIPTELQNALYDPRIIKAAHNAGFERVCLRAFLGPVQPPSQWLCTATMCRELGLPGSLEAAGQVVGLEEDKQKLKSGKALIRYFSIPCKPTKTNAGRTRNLPAHDPEKWKLYVEYNRQDVAVERELYKKLKPFKIHEDERALWIADQEMNDRGVRVDVKLAENAVAFDTEIKERLLEKAKDLSGLENPKSVSQLKDWIEETAGINAPSLNKKEIAGVRQAANHADVDEMLDLRAGFSKTSNEKYKAMIRVAGSDDRARGLTMFYGASRTGRYSGKLIQMQNLKSNKMPERDLDIARQIVRQGDLSTFEALYDDVPETLSQLIRTAFIPADGHSFVVADFSSIEARIIAWLAGEQWRLDVFNTHGKIYEASAERMFNLPPGSVGKGDPMRQKGKIAELALGFGGSVGALISMGALEMGLTEDELQPLVDSWRTANKRIIKLWYDTEAAAKETLKTGRPTQMQFGLAFRKDGPLLRFRLPNGRELSYVKPRLENGSVTYEGTFQTSGGWGRQETFSGKLVENCVQATARDCLANAILAVEAAGYPIVFTVHDEIICEVPTERADEALAKVIEIMSAPLPWAEGLPMNADGYVCEYYIKK